MKGAVSFVVLILIVTVVVSAVIYTYSASIEKPSMPQRTITGRAVADIPAGAPEICKTYWGPQDPICDDSSAPPPEGCGSNYKPGGPPSGSLEACNECQTGGFDCSKATIQPTSTTPSISQNCPNKQGSCQGKCGQYIANDKCGCDDLCVNYGDCYPDYQSVCKAETIKTVSTPPGLPSYCESYGSKSDIYCDDTEEKCNLGYDKKISAPECKECSTAKWISCRVICDVDTCIDLTHLDDYMYIEHPLTNPPHSSITGAVAKLPTEYSIQPILFIPKDIGEDKYVLNDLINYLTERITAVEFFYLTEIGKTFRVSKFIIVEGDDSWRNYLCNYTPYTPGNKDCTTRNFVKNMLKELENKGFGYSSSRLNLIFPTEPALFEGIASLGFKTSERTLENGVKVVEARIITNNWAVVFTGPTKAAIYGCDSVKDVTIYAAYKKGQENNVQICNIFENFAKRLDANYNYPTSVKELFDFITFNLIIHELGHVFGLPHPDEAEAKAYYGYTFPKDSIEYKGTPMGATYAPIVGALANEKGLEYKFLSEEKKILLTSSFLRYN